MDVMDGRADKCLGPCTFAAWLKKGQTVGVDLSQRVGAGGHQRQVVRGLRVKIMLAVRGPGGMPILPIYML